MSKNNQQQKQMDTQLSVATFTGTELGQELAIFIKKFLN